MKTVRDLLIDGLKEGHLILKTLGQINVTLNKNKLKILKTAIEDKDYYEIKLLLSKSRQGLKVNPEKQW